MQRVAAVVAWGAALLVVWEALDRSAWNDYGWVNYAPNSGVVFNAAPLSKLWVRVPLQLLLVVVWLAPSLWLLGDRSQEPAGEE